jgi:hypothetical protein
MLLPCESLEPPILGWWPRRCPCRYPTVRPQARWMELQSCSMKSRLRPCRVCRFCSGRRFQLAVTLMAPLLQALRCFLFKDPGSVLKGGVKVCKRPIVNEVLGLLLTNSEPNRDQSRGKGKQADLAASADVMAITKRSISGSEKSVPAKHQQSKRLRCAAIVFN